MKIKLEKNFEGEILFLVTKIKFDFDLHFNFEFIP